MQLPPVQAAQTDVVTMAVGLRQHMNRECAALAVTCTLKSATPIAHHMQAQKCARNSHRRQYTAEKCKRKGARDEPKYARGQLGGYAVCTLHSILHLNAFPRLVIMRHIGCNDR